MIYPELEDMDTPDNLRRLTESEALVESLQTMEFLTEFPSLEEKRDFRRFPPRYGDPHYHPSRLKRNGDNGPRRRENEERSSTDRPPPGRDNRRIGIGHRGFMSPMRRVAEAAHRTPEAHYTNNVDVPRESQEMIDTHHVDEEGDLTSRQLPPIERNIPTTNEQ